MKAEVVLTDMDALIASDEETKGHPLMPEGSRRRIAEELARLIVTRELLAAHIRTLRQRVGPNFRHRERLPDMTNEIK